MVRDQTRRRLLVGTGTLATGVLAGCSGSSDDDNNNNTNGGDGSGANGGDGTDDNGGDDGPAAWPSYAYDFQNTGHHPDTTGPQDGTEVAWTTEVDDNVDDDLKPVIGDGLVYWGSHNSTVYAVDAATGDIEWEADAQRGSKLLHDGKLYLSGGSELTCLDAATGEKYWSDEIHPKTSAVPYDGNIYVVGENKNPNSLSTYPVYEIDPATGDREALLEVQIQADRRLEIVFADHPAVADGTMVFCGNYRVHAVDLDAGEHAWTYKHEDEISVNKASPTVGDGHVFVQSPYSSTDDSWNSMWAIDADTGEEQWAFEPEKPDQLFGSPAYVDGTLYQQKRETVVAIDPSSGEQRWEEAVLNVSGSLLAVDGHLYFTARDRVTAFNVETRELTPVVERNETDRSDNAVVHGGTIFVVEGNGEDEPSTFYAFEAA